MNYKKQLHRFDSSKINNLSLYIFLIAFLISMLLNFLVAKRPLLITSKVYTDIILIIAIFIVGLAMHEGLHAVAALLFGKCGREDIKFGVNLMQGMLYCHIEKPITAKSYKIMLLIPAIVTGLIPLIIVTFLGNIFLIIVFCMLLCGGAADFIMFARLQKLDNSTLIMDHPLAPAFYALYDRASIPSDFVEVTLEEEEKLLKDMNANPLVSTDGKKNGMLKTLAILIFLSLAVLIIFIIGIVMAFL